ncbi:MAG: SAM-dependent methyltransferase [Magnetospirillum sp. WYHS-4]
MSGLLDILCRRIALEGPLSVAQYMAEVLGHPKYGYYMGRDPFGRGGDFTTAPEISQMFGEILGLWGALVWRAMGEPEALNLVELGPGRGTLMADMLRAARSVPGFRQAIRVHLVEISPALRARQREALGDVPATWHDSLDQVPQGPLLVIANEFFDALPIRQFQKVGDGWRERMVGLAADEKGLEFQLAPAAHRPPFLSDDLADAPEGGIVETCPSGLAVVHALAERLARFGGAALIVDYGHHRSGIGDTLQAVKGHAFHEVLADPGDADLTAHVDFEALGRSAAERGAAVYGPLPQGEFLLRLGLGARAAMLLQKATPQQAADIQAAFRRLTDPDEMGSLFKFLCLTAPGLPTPPGFDEEDASR